MVNKKVTKKIVRMKKVDSEYIPSNEITRKTIEDFLFGSQTLLTEDQKELFVQTAVMCKLNPFKREIYAIPYEEKYFDAMSRQKKSYNPPKYKLSILTGYEVYLKRAEATRTLDGWRVWTEGEGTSLKACIEIKRKDRGKPFYHEVYFSEYTQHNSMWSNKPRTMIKKVVISQGFRLCYPDEIGGLPYSVYEMPDRTGTNDESVVRNITGKEKKKMDSGLYRLPSDIMPDTLCDFGKYSKSPIPYGELKYNILKMLSSKSENPEELIGVMNYVLDKEIGGLSAGDEKFYEKNGLSITSSIIEKENIINNARGKK